MRTKLLLGALLLSTLPLVVASILLPMQVRSTLTKTGNDQLAQVARDLVTLTQNELQRNLETVRSIASVESMVDAISRHNAGTLDQRGLAATNSQLRLLLRQLADHYQGVFMTGADGRVFAGVLKTDETRPYVDLDLRDRSFFVQARDSGAPVISDPVRSKIGDVPIVVIAVPILDRDGAFAGIVGLSVEIEYLSTLISQQKLGQTGYAFAVDHQGLIIAHPDSQRVFNVDLDQVAGATHLAARMHRGETGVEEYVSSTGADKVAAFAPVPISGWSIAASMEIGEFVAPARHLRSIIIAMIGACVVLAIVVAAIFTVGLEKLKLAEAEKCRNEAELEAIEDQAPIMLLLLDGAGKVRRMNRATRRFAAHIDDTVAGLRVGGLFSCIRALDDSRGCGFAPDCAACGLRTVEADSVVSKTRRARVETTLHLVRGSETTEVVLLASTAGIEVDGQNMILLCLEDVTQQKRAEERVHDQAALLNVTQDAIHVSDLDGIILFWNRAAERIFGWTAAEAVGRRLADLFGDSFNAAGHAAAKEVVWTRGEWAGEYRQANRAGVIRILQGRATLVRDAAGDPRSIMVVNTDVTEAKEVETQFLRAQRLDSLGKLASGVAHDLNNVLSPILMSVELLRPLAVERKDREMLQLLSDSVKRGAGVVRQLLLFGRGNDEPRTNVALADVLAELSHMVRRTFPKNIAIATEATENLHDVLADPTQIHQVLLNLCVNARDAMPVGGILDVSAENVQLDALFVQTQPGAKVGPYVLLKVTDTGFGIPPEVLDKVFDPFFTTKPVRRGTGLGLSTVLGIVRSHGGFVTVHSRVGAGTEFAVYLPAAACENEGSAPVGIVASSGTGHAEWVLVTEDEAGVREMIRRNLEAANYHVLLAADGVEALALFAQHAGAIRLVVADMVMPEKDGMETIRALRGISPGLPIVAVSGLHDWRDRLERSGLADVIFLPKPFTAPALTTAVQKALASLMTAPTTAEISALAAG